MDKLAKWDPCKKQYKEVIKLDLLQMDKEILAY